MWAETANSFGWRSPQASAGTPKNTWEPARSGKKIPTDKGWDFRYWWSWRDLNPRPQAFIGQIYMFSGLI